MSEQIRQVLISEAVHDSLPTDIHELDSELFNFVDKRIEQLEKKIEQLANKP
jgi:tetrahydromethanopterin S-methyltransferase subunit G